MASRTKTTMIPLGSDQPLVTRMDRPLRKEIEELHTRTFGKGKRSKLIAPSLSSFIQYLVAKGLDAHIAELNKTPEKSA